MVGLGSNPPRFPRTGAGRDWRDDDRDALALVLRQLRSDVDRSTGRPQDLQPVIQFCGDREYPTWAKRWQTAWQRVGYGTEQTGVIWPDAIPATNIALLLVPVAPGRVGIAIGRTPLPLARPLLMHARLPDHVKPRDLALNLILRWAGRRPDGHLMRLGPPVLEYTQGGRVTRRELETYGETWSLPTPDGV